MKGTIEMGKHDFSIGPNGRVDGDIHAQNVSINGLFKGTVKALGKVAVTKEADFNGEIKAKSFSVEDGAYFKGVVELDREAHKKSADYRYAQGTIIPRNHKAVGDTSKQCQNGEVIIVLLDHPKWKQFRP